ncbi:MAG: extracellular solute-binding protein [Lachnospiraceae bacterium]|nr:extracellular solute-binding protein [Lachnospiraceae bacterium]
MKNLKKFLSLGIAAAMTLSLAACGGSASSSQGAAPADASTATAPAANVGTIENDGNYDECTIKFSWWGGDSRHAATQEAVKKFMEKYPGITVEVNFGAWSDWEAARALEFQSGTAADVNQINQSWINEFDSAGNVFLDLNQVSEIIDLSQWSEDSLAQLKDVNGGIAGVPVAMTGRTLYWDKTTFDEAGIGVPTTLEELRAAGKTFQEKLGDEYYPLALGEFDRAIFMTFYLQAKYGKAIIEDGQLNFTEEELKDGLDFIMSLEADHVIPSIKTIDGDAAASLDQNPKFIDGRYAGILEWDSAPLKYKNALGEGREFVVGEELKNLGGNDNTGVFTKVSLGFAISTTSQHPKEAAMLIEYLCNDPEGAAIMGSERGIPESKAGYEATEAAGGIDETIAAAHEIVMAASEYAEDPIFESNDLKGSEGTYKYVFGGLSYEEFDTAEAATELYDGISAACG